MSKKRLHSIPAEVKPTFVRDLQILNSCYVHDSQLVEWLDMELGQSFDMAINSGSSAQSNTSLQRFSEPMSASYNSCATLMIFVMNSFKFKGSRDSVAYRLFL